MIRQKNEIRHPSQAMIKEYHKNIQKSLINNQSGSLQINDQKGNYQFQQRMMEEAGDEGYEDDEFEQDGNPAPINRKKLQADDDEVVSHEHTHSHSSDDAAVVGDKAKRKRSNSKSKSKTQLGGKGGYELQ